MTPNSITFVFALLGGLVSLVCVAAFLTLREAGQRDLQSRVQAVAGGMRTGTPEADWSLGGSIARLLHDLGNTVRRNTKLYSDDDLAALEGMIAASGRNPRRVLPILLGVKVLLSILAPLSAYIYFGTLDLTPLLHVSLCVMALPIGLLLPDWIIGFLRRPYTAALRKGVPDALDLLVVCTEAGMGLESALEQVAREMAPSNPPIASSLAALLDEMKVLPDRKEALTNFGKRSGVEGIRRMATMLAQTLQYGTPLGQALRAVAGELRRERMVRLEERAVRLPALLVFPLVFFIMPSLFIVMGGIPVLGLLDLLTSISVPK